MTGSDFTVGLSFRHWWGLRASGIFRTVFVRSGPTLLEIDMPPRLLDPTSVGPVLGVRSGLRAAGSAHGGPVAGRSGCVYDPIDFRQFADTVSSPDQMKAAVRARSGALPRRFWLSTKKVTIPQFRSRGPVFLINPVFLAAMHAMACGPARPRPSLGHDLPPDARGSGSSAIRWTAFRADCAGPAGTGRHAIEFLTGAVEPVEPDGRITKSGSPGQLPARSPLRAVLGDFHHIMLCTT
jgi:hypothetical protein